jgi:hypothetical protein
MLQKINNLLFTSGIILFVILGIYSIITGGGDGFARMLIYGVSIMWVSSFIILIVGGIKKW